MGEVVLRIGDRRFGGWKQVSVSRSIEAFAGTFSIRATELSSDDPRGREILLGDPCEVLLDDRIVLSGFVDQRLSEWDVNRHDVTIGGRDVTGDLVDCSITRDPPEWTDRRVDQIVSDLVAPFAAIRGVRVETEVGARLAKFSAEPSETIYAAIDRACRHRGLLATSDGTRHLVLTRASRERIPLVLDRGRFPVLSGRAQFSERERFSQYEFRGQQRRSSSISAEQASDVRGRATDPSVRRFRPTVRIAEEPGGPEQLRDRARWEASIQQGRALRVEHVIAGWEWEPGQLWEPNRRVRVRDDWLGVHADLLIAGVTWSKGPAGSQTRLSLAPPEAFDVRSLPDPSPNAVAGSAAPVWTFDFSRFP